MILRAALNREAPRHGNLAAAIRACFAQSGGVDLELPPREPMRDPPTFAARQVLRPITRPTQEDAAPSPRRGLIA